MSVFATQYASIDEAWGLSSFAPAIVNPYKQPGIQSQILDNTTGESLAAVPQDQIVRRFINDEYKTRGIEGVKRLLDPAIIRDIQTPVAQHLAMSKTSTSAFSIPKLNQDEWMYVLLALFALMFAIEH